MNPRTDHTTVGHRTVRAKATTRRDTPLQDQTPFDLWPAATPAATAAPSQGLFPAHSRHAITTREHQTGGAPTRLVPTRRAHHPPRPPPSTSLPARPAGLKAKPYGWPPASLDPGGPADHAQKQAGTRPRNGRLPKNRPTHSRTNLTGRSTSARHNQPRVGSTKPGSPHREREPGIFSPKTTGTP
jgi:hypothetical protein